MAEDLVAQLAALSRTLRADDGSSFAALARMRALAEGLRDREDSPLTKWVAAALALTVARPFHDHPRFVDLIEIEIAALAALSDASAADACKTVRPMVERIEVLAREVLGADFIADRT